MKLFFKYLNSRKKGIIYFFFVAALLVFSFILYDLPLRAALYPLVLCAVTGMAILILDYRKVLEIHKHLSAIAEYGLDLSDNLPADDSMISEDYQHIISLLEQEQAKRSGDELQKYNTMIDYYTVWAHQIKTPIASMRLTLQNEDSALSKRLQNDLDRISRYVEMVLTFIRLDSDSTDYVFRRYPLDPMIKTSVRKFSYDFIYKHLSLEYEGLNKEVLTDEKWLSFVIEQILSNAVKYTDSGKITIYYAEPDTLCIQDTGIGIAREDIPRIFENGYTGFNGRTDKLASGVGLYLCKRICEKLGHEIRVDSELGIGTTVSVIFGTKEIEIE